MQVLDAYYVIDDIPSLSEKVQTFFGQKVILETHSSVKALLNQVRMDVRTMHSDV